MPIQEIAIVKLYPILRRKKNQKKGCSASTYLVRTICMYKSALDKILRDAICDMGIRYITFYSEAQKEKKTMCNCLLILIHTAAAATKWCPSTYLRLLALASDSLADPSVFSKLSYIVFSFWISTISSNSPSETMSVCSTSESPNLRRK